MNEAEIKELADTLEKDPRDWGGLKAGWKAAAELRRLSAINAELKLALTQLISRTKHLKPCEGTLQLAEQALEKSKQ